MKFGTVLLALGWLLWASLTVPGMLSAADEKGLLPGEPKSLPVYKPPLRGAPVGRLGGGTRGAGADVPRLAALVPDHAGLTIQEQPALFWFLSSDSNWTVEVTLLDANEIDPLIEHRISPPVKAGIHRLNLADHGIRLPLGSRFKWFVALVPDPDHRSKDIIAGGVVERVEITPSIREKLAKADPLSQPHVYAEAGLWYDALSCVSDLIDQAPADPARKRMREALLEQVGLAEVTAR